MGRQYFIALTVISLTNHKLEPFTSMSAISYKKKQVVFTFCYQYYYYLAIEYNFHLNINLLY